MRISDQQLNRLTVLKAIRRAGPVARRDLPALTRLSAGSITQLTADLVDRAMVSERREDGKRNGRPRTLLAINPEGAVIIAASLMGSGLLHIAFVDLSGQRQHSVESRIGPHKTLQSMADAIGGALESAIAEASVPPERVARIAIALPALVDSVRGAVHFMTTFPPGPPVPFAAPIFARLGIPVTIENDICCMARAEHWFGRAQTIDTFTLVHLGFNIGSADYVGGLPKIAANGLNPELGHVKIDSGPGARRCFCGAAGCLSAYASMYGILQTAHLLDDLPFPPVRGLAQRFDEFLEMAAAGDQAAITALRQAGAHIGNVLASLISATDTSAVLVAVNNARLLDIVRQPIEAALRRNLMPGILPVTPVTLIVADEDWRWKGTAALALEQIFLGPKQAL
jgi:predicted NBD/HSP70 family sugar kinase